MFYYSMQTYGNMFTRYSTMLVIVRVLNGKLYLNFTLHILDIYYFKCRSYYRLIKRGIFEIIQTTTFNTESQRS